MNKRFKSVKKLCSAFTMAEILLAMTIIGVISVLVLPSVTSGTSAKQYLVTYKKSLSVLNQAADTNYAMSGWDFAGQRDNYMNAVGEIFTNRMGATLDEDTEWTISGTAGSGFIDDCVKAGGVAENTVCFSANSTPLLKVNSSAEGDPKTKVYAMKDGLASVVLLGNNLDTNYHVPCRVAGQRTVNVTKDGEDDVTSYSSAANYCLAYLDVNGSTGPNQIVTCSNGVKNDGMIKDDITIDGCKVYDNMVFDVYPIIIYGDTVAPASAAALAIFQEKFDK